MLSSRTDIIRNHIDAKPPIDENLEEIALGTHRMYLNHGNKEISLSGYDLLTESDFESIPPYGVMLVGGDKK